MVVISGLFVQCEMDLIALCPHIIILTDWSPVLTEPQLYVRFDIWEQGNVSPLQLSDNLQGALRHALCDVVMELRVLPNPLCLGVAHSTKSPKEDSKGETIS